MDIIIPIPNIDFEANFLRTQINFISGLYAVGGYRSKGTIKQLLWLAGGNLARATRMKFSPPALKESTQFLEEFVSYHLGKQPRSLKFLRQIRA